MIIIDVTALTARVLGTKVGKSTRYNNVRVSRPFSL
jgi:hypothetical protein